jgi:hypothetical protein
MRAKSWPKPCWLMFSCLVAAQPLSAAEPTGQFVATETLAAPEARQASAADDKYVYAIDNRVVAKYDRRTKERVAVSTGEAEHLNSGFFWKGKLLCAHSNFPKKPAQSLVMQLDPETMQLSTLHDFGNLYGSLTWVVHDERHWWCTFAHYGANNPNTVLVEFDDDWREVSQWKYPTEVIKDLGGASISGGLWWKGDLWTIGHDHPRLYRLRLPKSGNVLELIATVPAPFPGQGIALDPVSGSLMGINRGKQQMVFSAWKD